MLLLFAPMGKCTRGPSVPKEGPQPQGVPRRSMRPKSSLARAIAQRHGTNTARLMRRGIPRSCAMPFDPCQGRWVMQPDQSLRQLPSLLLDGSVAQRRVAVLVRQWAYGWSVGPPD